MTGTATITGTGAISSAGAGTAALWSGMSSAMPVFSETKDPCARMAVRLLYAVADELVPETALVPDGEHRSVGRTSSLGLVAAREAVAVAQRSGRALDPRRTGVIVGTGMGETGAQEQKWAGLPTGDAARQPAFSVAATIAQALGLRGPVLSVSNACAASAYAVGLGSDMLAVAECDAVVVVGAESYSRVALGAFNRMGALDPVACRPFAADRAGTVFGEGAAALVLEAADTAARRGAIPVASLLGAAFSCDASHPTAPDQDGAQAARTVAEALAAAGVTPARIGAVIPHGTGTLLNDAVEAAVLHRRSEGVDLPLYSLKALLGHTGGAAGALAAVAAVEIARRSTVPPNVDVGALDPQLPVSVSLSERRSSGAVLVNAYAFGGNNATLVIGAAE